MKLYNDLFVEFLNEEPMMLLFLKKESEKSLILLSLLISLGKRLKTLQTLKYAMTAS